MEVDRINFMSICQCVFTTKINVCDINAQKYVSDILHFKLIDLWIFSESKFRKANDFKNHFCILKLQIT